MSKPIEQLRMTWGVAHQAEIARRTNDSFAEMVHPKAIDEYARREWMLARR